MPPGTEMGQKDLVGSTSAKLRKELEWQVEEVGHYSLEGAPMCLWSRRCTVL